ncbi:MAG: hypothetical protein R3C24_01725 [Cyanobacteriota/Melainabacteria group bacterium]
MLECLEIELVKEKQFGQILLEQGIVTHELPAPSFFKIWSPTIAYEPSRPVTSEGACGQSGLVYQGRGRADPPVQAPQKHISSSELLVQSGLVDQDKMNELVPEELDSSIKVGSSTGCRGN